MKKALVPALLVAAGVCLAAVLAEVGLRAVGYSNPVWYQPDARLGWRLRPGLLATYKETGRMVRINAEGLRDRDHVAGKLPGTYRIAVLGDDYAEARQVEREQAFWALLPGELAACGFAAGKRIEVLNFGVSGYGTAQEYLMLESTALRYRPDLVLLQFSNADDVRNNSFALDAEKERPFFMAGADGELLLDESFSGSPGFRASTTFASEAMRKLTDRSRLLQLARASKTDSFIPTAVAAGEPEAEALAAPRDALWEDAWRVTEGLIAMSAEFAQRNGARFAVVTVPDAAQVHPDPARRAALQARLGGPDLFYPDRRIADLARGKGFFPITLAPDMQPLAGKSGSYFHGFGDGLGRGRWNAAGHAAAARLIARDLCRDGG